MAGAGSRLRGSDPTFLKPLVSVLGRPLISYTIDALVRTGVEKINAVVGFESDRLSAALERLIPPGTELRLIENHNWRKQNGISVLASAPYVTAPFLLTMSDHVFDKSIIDLLVREAGPRARLALAEPRLEAQRHAEPAGDDLGGAPGAREVGRAHLDHDAHEPIRGRCGAVSECAARPASARSSSPRDTTCRVSMQQPESSSPAMQTSRR